MKTEAAGGNEEAGSMGQGNEANGRGVVRSHNVTSMTLHGLWQRTASAAAAGRTAHLQLPLPVCRLGFAPLRLLALLLRLLLVKELLPRGEDGGLAVGGYEDDKQGKNGETRTRRMRGALDMKNRDRSQSVGMDFKARSQYVNRIHITTLCTTVRH